MALAETARLIASLELKDQLSPAAKKAMATVGKMEGTFFRVGQQIGRGLKNAAHNLRNIGLVAGGAIALAVRGGVQSLAELEDATMSVDGAIRQLGLSGQLTSRQVATWANEIEASVDAAFDDKEITAAATTLLRFGRTTPANLRQALVVMTDLAAKTGSVDSAANQLAKALADPTKAAGKLAKNGVILTKAQEDQIKAFVEAGKVGKAQKLVLDAVAASTKGAAAASAGPYRDALNTLEDATEDAQRALGIGFLPVIQTVAGLLKSELAKPSTIAGLKAFGETLATGLDSLISIARNLPWDAIGDAFRVAGTGARAVLGAFQAMPPWVQTAVLTGWGLNKLTGGALSGIVTELGKGLIKGVLGMTAAVVNIKAGVVNGGGGLPGKGGVPPLPAAAGIGALGLGTAVTILAIAPVAMAALGIAIAKATDPTGERRAEGKSEIASARGIPDWNNKALNELRGIRQNTEREGAGKGGKRDSTTQAETTKGNVFGPGGLAQSITDAQRAAAEKVTTSVESMRGRIADELATTKSTLSSDIAAGAAEGARASLAVRDQVTSAKAQVASSGQVVSRSAFLAGVVNASATRAGSSSIVSAIWAARPITNVYVSGTTVDRKTTVTGRGGATDSDRNGGGDWRDVGRGGGG